jgi:hypothetical protein
MCKYSKGVNIFYIYSIVVYFLNLISCAICFQGISRDKVCLILDVYHFILFLCSFCKVSFYQNMQNLSTYCSNCDWIGSFKDYEV